MLGFYFFKIPNHLPLSFLEPCQELRQLKILTGDCMFACTVPYSHDSSIWRAPLQFHYPILLSKPLLLVGIDKGLPGRRFGVQKPVALGQVSTGVVARVFKQLHIFEKLLRVGLGQERLKDIRGS